jgi:hypothetical protein
MSKICAADCSENCFNDKKCKCFIFNTINYNVCENDECNIFVCKACSIELNKHEITNCIVNCNKEIISEENLNNIQRISLDIENTKTNSCNCCNFNIFIKTDDIQNESILDDNTNCCIFNLFNRNIIYPNDYNSIREFYTSSRILHYTKKIATFLGILLVPILLTLLIFIIQTKGDILNQNMPKSFFESILVLLLFWNIGFLIILLIICLINCITGKLHM